MARSFNGSSQYLRTTSNITGGEFTFVAWMKWDSVSGTYMQACQWYESGLNKHWYLLSINTSLYFGHSENGSTGSNQIHSTALTSGAWIHVCARFKNGTHKKLSINGTHETGTTPGTIYSSGTPGFTIGADAGATFSLYWPGKIADAAIWSASLADAEVEAMASGLRTADQIRPDALVPYWPLGGLRPDNDLDQWGKAYDLTATGSPTSVDSPRLWYPDDVDVVTGTAAATTTTAGGLLLLGVGA